ncbi:MAG: hypothetical protein JWN56_1543 [Sphingobacteriales bacterium]|nr:hypothetical protein [Sphingobacteriales bacterium]
MITIYFLSGLGADERVFMRLKLPAGYQMQLIPWEPVNGDETLEQYARHLARKIDASKPFLLAGLSFGGIVASEICKFLKPEKLILFSTVTTQHEFRPFYRLAGTLRLYKLLPTIFMRLSLPFAYWFFGPLDKEGKKLITDYVLMSDGTYLRWSLGQISRWQNTEIFHPHIRIHGTKDRAFPLKSQNAPSYVIQKGGHSCVFTHANEVSEILWKELA